MTYFNWVNNKINDDSSNIKWVQCSRCLKVSDFKSASMDFVTFCGSIQKLGNEYKTFTTQVDIRELEDDSGNGTSSTYAVSKDVEVYCKECFVLRVCRCFDVKRNPIIDTVERSNMFSRFLFALKVIFAPFVDF